jgi:hypothetical protein
MDLVELPNRLDGDTLDFKRDPFSQDGVLRTIVAFAISAGGGTLLLDQNDESHPPCSVDTCNLKASRQSATINP